MQYTIFSIVVHFILEEIKIHECPVCPKNYLKNLQSLSSWSVKNYLKSHDLNLLEKSTICIQKIQKNSRFALEEIFFKNQRFVFAKSYLKNFICLSLGNIILKFKICSWKNQDVSLRKFI